LQLQAARDLGFFNGRSCFSMRDSLFLFIFFKKIFFFSLFSLHLHHKDVSFFFSVSFSLWQGRRTRTNQDKQRETSKERRRQIENLIFFFKQKKMLFSFFIDIAVARQSQRERGMMDTTPA